MNTVKAASGLYQMPITLSKLLNNFHIFLGAIKKSTVLLIFITYSLLLTHPKNTRLCLEVNPKAKPDRNYQPCDSDSR